MLYYVYARDGLVQKFVSGVIFRGIMLVKENSYVQIEAFMVNDLHLSGNELIVYAVIFGFSQDGESWFTGSRKYLASWCQTSEKSVTNNLKKLLEAGLIRKRTRVVHGCTFNDYAVVEPSSLGGKKVPSAGEESSLSRGEESSHHILEIDNASEDASNLHLFQEAADGIPYNEIIGYLNERTGRHYRCVEATKRLIRARLNDGYTLDDFKTVIDKMCRERMGTELEKYLRPATLFAPSHFDDYLNWAVRPNKEAISNDSTRAGVEARGFYGDGTSWSAEDFYDC